MSSSSAASQPPGRASSNAEGPCRIGGFEAWQGALDAARYAFLGKGTELERQEIVCQTLDLPHRAAWVDQVHSCRLLQAEAGVAGSADALHTDNPTLALCLQTADCVPILMVCDDRILAVHAGWRGIAAGIVTKSLERLTFASPIAAILGPAIGPCCYEVGEDVARAVGLALESPDEAILQSDSGKPHIDLQAAVAQQLLSAGVAEPRRIEVCTRCNPDLLWSYRRSGPGAGRNFSFIWLP